MEKYFVTYEQALALNDLGFKEPCIATIDQTEYFHIKGTKQFPRGAMMYYTIDLPLKSQAFEWFRKEHHMFSHIMTYEGNEIPHFKGEFAYFAEIDFLIAYEEIEKPFKTYEEAESACIDKLIEIVKDGREINQRG